MFRLQGIALGFQAQEIGCQGLQGVRWDSYQLIEMLLKVIIGTADFVGRTGFKMLSLSLSLPLPPQTLRDSLCDKINAYLQQTQSFRLKGTLSPP